MLNRLKRFFYRPADFYIGGKENPYMRRWWVIPRNRFFNVYLHHILRSDDDRALHDHPWWFVSIILKGGYYEHIGWCWCWWRQTGNGFWGAVFTKWRKRWSIAFNKINHAHRVEIPEGQTAWTLVFTGPVCRTWGFYCPKGWMPWQDFVDHTDTGNIGKGCE